MDLDYRQMIFEMAQEERIRALAMYNNMLEKLQPLVDECDVNAMKLSITITDKKIKLLGLNLIPVTESPSSAVSKLDRDLDAMKYL